VFGITLLSVVTLMHVYVFWRADSVPFLKHNIFRKLLIGTSISLWSVFPLGRYLGHGGTGTWGPRMRLWLPGEILRVTLYVKKGE
jgi:uncharacterized protein